MIFNDKKLPFPVSSLSLSNSSPGSRFAWKIEAYKIRKMRNCWKTADIGCHGHVAHSNKLLHIAPVVAF
jgi:hypothetical protein